MFTFIVTLLLASTTVLATPLQTIIRSEGTFSYDPDSGIGPADWGDIPGFETCGTGQKQSPINVLTNVRKAPMSRGPQPNFEETELKFGRTVENFELDCEKEGTCGFTLLNGERFNLVNLHFHSKSEHKLAGKRFPLESHMVHRSESEELLVIGTFYRIVKDDDDDDEDDDDDDDDDDDEDDEDDDDDDDDDDKRGTGNPVLEKILDQIESGETDITVDLPGLLGRKGYIGYSGSLTTPPCSEEVNWFIALKIQPISRKQVRRYRKIAESGPSGNNRPVQALNDRTLTAFVRKY